MNWFNNIKIKTKILYYALSIVFLTAIIGFIGLKGINTMNTRTADMYNNMVVPLSITSDISTSFQQVRYLTQKLVLAKTESEANNIIKSISSIREKITRLVKSLESHSASEKERQYVNILKESRKTYGRHLDNIVELKKNNKVDEANALLNGEMEESAQKEEESITNLDTSKVNEAENIDNENDQLAGTSQNMMILFLIAGILVSLSLGYFIANYLTKGISKVVSRMKSLEGICISNIALGVEQLAEGELNIKIETSTLPIETKSNDEIGTISKNINQIIIKVQETVAAVEKAAAAIKDTINESQALVDAAVEGKLSVRGNESKFKGSFKELIKGLNDTFDAVVRPIKESGKVLEQISSGDLTVRMDKEYKGDYALIKHNINQLADSFENALSRVSETIEATASAANQISSSTEEMAAGAEEQNQQTSEVAGAVDQMTKTILETAKNSAAVSEAAISSGTIAKDGGAVVFKTIEGMNKIAEVVKKSADTVHQLGKNNEQIGEIIQVIDDIADQTNLLALNAAIEAARAGEQGRGFAVVADEVRKLAERTTRATKEIASMIKQIQSDTEDAVKSMRQGTEEVEKGKEMADKAGNSLKLIIEGAEQVVDMSAQVAAASEEQSASAEQISKNIEAISSVTEQNTSGVQQIARAAEDLNKLTYNLKELISKFKIGVIKEHVEANSLN